MSKRIYFEDLKNLQARPLDLIQKSEDRCQKSEKLQLPTSVIRPPSLFKNHKSTINNHQSESSMEKLNTSKTMWGFGIAVFIYILQSMLVAFNITSPDNLILKTFIEVVIAVSGFFGVYGVRDALRKMSL